MAYNFQRPFRLIERLFPGSQSTAGTPEPSVVSELVQPIWPAFALRQIETQIQINTFPATAVTDGTMTFQFNTAPRERVYIPVLCRALHSNAAARSVELSVQFNTITTERLQADPWIQWRAVSGGTPALSLDLVSAASGFTNTLKCPIPFLPEGNTLLLRFLGMVAASGGTAQCELWYIDAPEAIIEMQLSARASGA